MTMQIHNPKGGMIYLTADDYNRFWHTYNVTNPPMTFEEYVVERMEDEGPQFLAEDRIGNHIDGFDRDDLGESPDY